MSLSISYRMSSIDVLNLTDQILSLTHRQDRLGDIRKLFVIGQLYVPIQDVN